MLLESYSNSVESVAASFTHEPNVTIRESNGSNYLKLISFLSCLKE
jgi:hypothetical protein